MSLPGPPWLPLVVLPAFIALVVVLLVFASLPRQPSLELDRWPAALQIYLGIIVSAVTKRGEATARGPGREGDHRAKSVRQISVTLKEPQQLDGKKLAAYRLLVHDHERESEKVPMMYLVVEAFRLTMQVMALPQFPFSVLGSVLKGNQTMLVRPVAPDERLVYRCTVDPSFRIHPKGYTEVDVVTTASSEADAKLVWRSVVTVIIMGGKRAPEGGKATAEPRPAGPPEASAWPVLDEYQLAGDAGRRYGSLNGDFNPIHLHPLTARLFGFKRPIAHALFLVGCAEASLRRSGVVVKYPALLSTDFRRPTLLPARLRLVADRAELALASAVTQAPQAGVVTRSGSKDAGCAAGAAGVVRFAILTDDRQKEVLVGSLGPAPRE